MNVNVMHLWVKISTRLLEQKGKEKTTQEYRILNSHVPESKGCTEMGNNLKQQQKIPLSASL